MNTWTIIINYFGSSVVCLSIGRPQTEHTKRSYSHMKVDITDNLDLPSEIKKGLCPSHLKDFLKVLTIRINNFGSFTIFLKFTWLQINPKKEFMTNWILILYSCVAPAITISSSVCYKKNMVLFVANILENMWYFAKHFLCDKTCENSNQDLMLVHW